MKADAVYRFIGNAAPAYNAMLSLTGYNRAVRKLVRDIPFDRDDRFSVLDAACGTGSYTLAILETFRNAKVTAFDLNPQMIEAIQERLHKQGFENRADVFAADITQPLQLKEEAFDLLIISGILEHVDPDSTIRSLTPLVKKHGYLLHVPLTDTPLAKLIAKIYGAKIRLRKEYHTYFTRHGWESVKLVEFPEHSTASYKEVQLYQK